MFLWRILWRSYRSWQHGRGRHEGLEEKYRFGCPYCSQKFRGDRREDRRKMKEQLKALDEYEREHPRPLPKWLGGDG